MSDGMREYWKARKAREHERNLKYRFHDMLIALLRNKPSPRLIIQDMEKAVQGLIREHEKYVGSMLSHCPQDETLTEQESRPSSR